MLADQHKPPGTSLAPVLFLPSTFACSDLTELGWGLCRIPGLVLGRAFACGTSPWLAGPGYSERKAPLSLPLKAPLAQQESGAAQAAKTEEPKS